jgi:hypothetical protein
VKVYLYVKQHNRTGLKYFGKTQTQNPEKYSGSGIYWKNHIKKHGNDVSTIEIWEFDNIDECSKFAMNFSIQNNIVESVEWANQIIENGIDGWPKGNKRGPQTPEHRQKNSNAIKGDKNPMYGIRKNKNHMKEIGLLGIEKQKTLRNTSDERREKEQQRLKYLWDDTLRREHHKNRFTGHAPAKDNKTGEYIGLVSLLDTRWHTGEISSPQKGVKKGITKAKGKPKEKKICRLVDKKEMDLANYKKWAQRYE